MQDEFGQLPSDVARPLRRQQQPTSASRSSRGHRRPPPLPSGAASPDHLVLLRSSDMEAWESESPMAAVTLPSRPPPMPPSMASGSSVGGPLPLPPRGSSSHSRPARPPPMLGRTSSLPLNQGGGPPVVPPRPESTLTSNSRRIQPSSASQQQPRQQSSRHPEGPKPKSQLRPTQSLVPPSQPAVINPDNLVALPVTTRPLDERIPRIEAGEPHQPISLSSPRQATTRAQNLYVEAPLCGPSSEASLKGLGHKGLPSGSKATGLASVHSGRDRSKGAKGHPIQSTSTTSQCDNSKINHDPFSPASSTNSPVESIGAPALFTTSVSPRVDNKDETLDSIICIDCGRCRCRACQTPKKLPEAWVSGVRVSKDTVVDALSCMWCVKAVLYHCAKDSEESIGNDLGDREPCGCTGAHRASRWTAMGLLSLFLPCLWCYLPLKGCAKGVEAVYQRCTAGGCRCPDRDSNRSSNVIASEPTSTATLSSVMPSSPTTSLQPSNSKLAPPSSPTDAKQRLLEQ